MTTRKRIIRAAHNSENPYVMILREIPQNKSLSWEARGVLCYLLSQPDDWKTDIADLKQNCGEHTVYRVLKELKSSGYVIQEKHRNSKGKYVNGDYIVYERPRRGNQDVDNRDVDFPHLENRDDKDTYKQKETNKKDSVSKKDTGAAVIDFPSKPAVEKKAKTPRQADPLFDVVKTSIFGIDGDATGGRIAKISNWLAGKYEGKGVQGVGKIKRPAEPSHVAAFAKYCKEQGMTPPRDLVKFVENWRAWASTINGHKPPNLPSLNPDEVPDDWGAEHFVREANDVA